MLLPCRDCEVKKEHTEFNKHPKTRTGFQPNCKACQKLAYQKSKLNPKPVKAVEVEPIKPILESEPTKRVKSKYSGYLIPDGQGGKWQLDLKALKANAEVLALTKKLGKQNKNVKRISWNNLMLISYDKAELDLIAKTAKMNPKAVYEISKVELKTNKPLPSKFGLMLYF